MLLKDVLSELGNNVAPYYHTKRYINPVLGEYYLTRVHVRVVDGFRGKRIVSAHDSDGPLPTYYDSVSSAARRALWSLCHTNRQDLQATEYRHLPRRARGTEETVMTLGGEEGRSVRILARATAALNTDLEGVTTELIRT